MWNIILKKTLWFKTEFFLDVFFSRHRRRRSIYKRKRKYKYRTQSRENAFKNDSKAFSLGKKANPDTPSFYYVRWWRHEASRFRRFFIGNRSAIRHYNPYKYEWKPYFPLQKYFQHVDVNVTAKFQVRPLVRMLRLKPY